MRVVKLGLISAIVFAVILFLFSLLIPSTVRISRAVNIQAPQQAVHAKISSLQNWSSWNELYSNNIDVTIHSVTPGMVSSVWKNKDRTLESSFRLEQSAGVTVVQWFFDFRLKWYPWEKFSSITFDKQFGPLMERSLNNLKKELENSP